MPIRNAGVLVRGLLKYSDIAVAVGVILMVVMMVVPLPTPLLDLLLAFNLTFALVILLVTMYTTEPLQFSIFPSLLLITTLFRLALNVSSTRLILLKGFAGNIIQAFGQFVVGGNAVVGFIVFLILVVIQFIVITRGAERVAEVAARFTLDAMPGKQMAIDADLNAGLINEARARERRREIEREADFYGAMDGASKFVKGDAIAGIIITVINIIGGFIIGVAQQGKPAGEALSTYALLTVGDGLVSQIPALLISTATGIVVTRAASESNLGQDLVGQILAQPKILAIASAVLVLFGLVPGLPRLPFFVLAAGLGTLAYVVRQAAADREREEADQARAREREAVRKPENVLSLLQVDPLEIEVGYGLVPLASQDQGGELLERLLMIRRQIALDLGLVVPPIRIRDNLQLKPNTYLIKIKGVDIAEGEVFPDRYLAMDPGGAADAVPGIQGVEPAFGLPALWINGDDRERAELAGYTVVDPPSVVATHLTEIIKTHAHELLGRQEVQALIDTVKQNHSAVVEELVPNLLTLGEVQKVLQNLLRERVSIRDLVTILETLADHARATRDPDVLTEYARQSLARGITRQNGLDKGAIPAITIDPRLEERILGAVQRTDHGTYLALDPDEGRRILESLASEVERGASSGQMPVVLCSSAVRGYLRRLTERAMPRLLILSYNELDQAAEVRTIGVVRT